MAATSRRAIKLESGTVLHKLSNEGQLYGLIAIEAGGSARIWVHASAYTYAPTKTVFPGFISAARAAIQGWV